MNEYVSIVIPTYNRQKVWATQDGGNTLISNLLNQDYPFLEIIIVNDGSQDNTTQLLKQHASEDSRIRVIEKPNGGLSSARNKGIEVASGEYIFFIDDDDNIPSDYISSFMQTDNSGFDLVMDSYNHCNGSKEMVKVKFEEKEYLDTNEFISDIFEKMSKYCYPFFAHGKRFKTSVIKDNHITFPDNNSIIEDRPFFLEYIKHSSKYKITNNNKYIINNDPKQDYRLSQSIRPIESWWIVFKNGFEYLNRFAEDSGHDEIKYYSNNYIADKTFFFIINHFHTDYKNQKEFLYTEIRSYLRKNIKLKEIKNTKVRSFYKMWFSPIHLVPIMLLKFLK